ncbi:MAG TPA: hypothetical protein PLW77_02400 [Bacteroidales bacterium]|mgnify:CR=1 FL=1|nr:hypothetical protein [Bacteroidales bacterium]HQB21877.1 hypothetical protein [Bacteroidales bacterium]
MELVKQKREDEFVNLVKSNLKKSSRTSVTNKQSLKEFVNYLSKLKKDNIISEKQFSELLSWAFSSFVKNEVEIRVSKSLNDKITLFFEKL